VCLPKGSTELLLKSWQTREFKFLVAAEKIDQSTEDQMRSWPHSGFSFDDSVYLSPGDTFGLERLAQYILRCPFSLARVVRLTDDGSVIYRSEKDHCRRFPGAASGDLHGGPRRNFQVFSALDFLAELTQHIPEKGEHLVRYYGSYSHRQRGIQAKLRAASRGAGVGSGHHRSLGARNGETHRQRPASRFGFDLGQVDQTGVRSRPAGMQVWRSNEDHQLH